MLEKTYNPHVIEEKHYTRWEASGALNHEQDSAKPAFCIMMPPPNVTGSLHMGHALNYTLQDVVVRYFRMRGYDVLWQPGMDHAGIATQIVVERQLEAQGLHRRQLGRSEFIKKVWEWKEKSGGIIVKQQRRLGISPSWSRQRFTMDEGLSNAVRKVFVQLYQDGLIYRAKRLVNWDPKLLTAVSDLEVKNIETNGHLWFIKYPLADKPETYITVATTRPETMFGDTAVAVNPQDQRYQHLIGQSVRLPFMDRLIPIIADEAVDQEKGTGAVKVTPAHDFNDFEMGKRHQLPMPSIMDIHAHLTNDVPQPFGGNERFAARKMVVEELENLGLLEKIEPTIHAVPHGERSDEILEPYLTDQWFIDAEKLAQRALSAVAEGETAFIPDNWKTTYDHWLTNIQPWCISRQLWWGHRIPAWYGPDQEIFVAETEEDAHTQAKLHYGKNVQLQQDEDVLDTWFSSALWPFSTLGWPEETSDLNRYYPNSLLITGIDIIFFWVARMMMMGLYVMKQVPFKTVFLHALVRDEHGKKMSKSRGNIVDPLDIIDEYGADALRFTMTALAGPGRDVKYSTAIVEGYRNFATKFWNAARFCEFNQAFYDTSFVPTKCTSPLNQWIISELATLTEKVDQAYARYRFDEVASLIYQFIWGTYCDWYVEFTKPLLQEGIEDIKHETRQTLGWVLGNLCHILHPIMPFITEEIWSNFNPKESLLITSKWPLQEPHQRKELQHGDAAKAINWVIELVSRIRGVRSEINVPAASMVDLWVKGASPTDEINLHAHESLIKKMARLQSIVIQDDFDVRQGVAQFMLGECTIMIPVSHLIDLNAEKERLKKSLQKTESELVGLKAKLENQEFLNNAPEDIINKNQARYQDMILQKEKFTEALSFLSGPV